jgi:hypothetical protein
MASSRNKAQTWPYPRHGQFRDRVEEAAAAWFAVRGCKVRPKTPYVLASRNNWPHNIISPEVVEYIRRVRAERASQGQGFALHRWVHHGLSSQALLFNLVGPLILHDDLAMLEEPFSSQVSPWPAGPVTARLEHENRAVFNENYGQPTSIDLVLQDEASRLFLFVECKFVETEFGGCSLFESGDCDGRNPTAHLDLCYLHYIGRRYWELLGEHGFLKGPIGREKTCILASHYQFFRCLLFALEHDSPFVLLSDERSPTFDCPGFQGRRGLLPFLRSLVPEALRSQVVSVSIQQVVAAIKKSGRHSWVTEFERKYGLS